jgi:hypothetical protein
MDPRIQERLVQQDIFVFIQFIKTIHTKKITMHEIYEAIQYGGPLHRLHYPNSIIEFTLNRKLIEKQGNYIVLK